jgi:hypothetical protein
MRVRHRRKIRLFVCKRSRHQYTLPETCASQENGGGVRFDEAAGALRAEDTKVADRAVNFLRSALQCLVGGWYISRATRLTSRRTR